MNESEEGALQPPSDGGAGAGAWDMYKSEEPTEEASSAPPRGDVSPLDEEQRRQLAELSTLVPQAITLWRVQGVVGLAIALVATAVAYLLLSRNGPDWTWVTAVMLGVVVGWFLAYFFTIPIRYRQWRWSLNDERLYVENGVVVHSTMLVPRNRIQNVTTDAGPLQRYYGLSTLKVHTAGMRTPNVEIPAVTHEITRLVRAELGHQE